MNSVASEIGGAPASSPASRSSSAVLWTIRIFSRRGLDRWGPCPCFTRARARDQGQMLSRDRNSWWVTSPCRRSSDRKRFSIEGLADLDIEVRLGADGDL